MKAVVFHGVGDVRLENVPEPKIKEPNDAIVRITASAICGTDLHFIRGTFSGMKDGRILGHEALGVVEETGSAVRNFREGDRVIIPSTLGCGSCNYCRAGFYSQCDRINPAGKLGGTVFFGGPEAAGGLDGLQAEYARVPYAATNLMHLPEEITDDQGIMMSDILPTSYQAARMADIHAGDTVAIFGCGPVGMLAIACAQHMGAGRCSPLTKWNRGSNTLVSMGRRPSISRPRILSRCCATLPLAPVQTESSMQLELTRRLLMPIGKRKSNSNPKWKQWVRMRRRPGSIGGSAVLRPRRFSGPSPR